MVSCGISRKADISRRTHKTRPSETAYKYAGNENLIYLTVNIPGIKPELDIILLGNDIPDDPAIHY